MSPPLSTGLVALVMSDSALYTFEVVLQGMVASGVSAAVPSPFPSAPTRKVVTLSLLHFQFSCRLVLDGDLRPIWEAVARGKRSMEGLATLNQALMWGLSSCFWVFGGRYHFRASLPLLMFVKNVNLLNPYLEPACAGGVFTPWLTCQRSVDASTRGGADASLLAHKLDWRLALV